MRERDILRSIKAGNESEPCPQQGLEVCESDGRKTPVQPCLLAVDDDDSDESYHFFKVSKDFQFHDPLLFSEQPSQIDDVIPAAGSWLIPT